MSSNPWLRLWRSLRLLIEELENGRYWTQRRDACDQLVRAARQIAFRLRRAAEDKDPDVAHWARQGLAQLQGDAAEPLAELAPRLARELDESAPPLTGANADSIDPENWEMAVQTTAGRSERPEPMTAEQLAACLESFAGSRGGVFQARSTGAQIELPVEGGRRQTIILDRSQNDSTGQPIALFYSICGEARPEDFEWALEANARLSRGAFGIIQQGERHVMVMMLRRRLEDLLADTLPKKLDYIARKADWAESRLSAEDRH